MLGLMMKDGYMLKQLGSLFLSLKTRQGLLSFRMHQSLYTFSSCKSCFKSFFNICFKISFKNMALILSILSLGLVSVNAQAAMQNNKEPSIYEALLPVTNLNKEEKAIVMREGFKKVLVQVSGSEKTLSNTSIQKAVDSADDYVTQFSIQEDAEKNRFIRIKFNQAHINSLLQQSKSPILSRSRPSTTVWMVMSRDKNDSHWVGEEYEQELFQQIQTIAKQRRVPLIFPLLDLTDTDLVSEQAVLDDEFSSLETASERYNAEVIWIGKLSKEPSGWYGQWTLLSKGNTEQWDNSNVDLEALCKDAMDELASRSVKKKSMAKANIQSETQSENHSRHSGLSNTKAQFNSKSQAQAQSPVNAQAQALAQTHTEVQAAQSPITNQTQTQSESTKAPLQANNRTKANPAKLQVSVAGINGIEDYAKVMEYLKTLPNVKAVEVTAVQPNQTVFELVSTGGREGVAKSIAAGRILNEFNKSGFENNGFGNNHVENNGVENKTENNGILMYKIAEVM